MSFWEKNCQVEGVRDAEATDRTLLSAFLENIPDLVYFKDRDSRFIAVSRSKAERHGLDPAGFIGLGDADFFTAEHAQWARVDEEHVMNTGEPILGKIERIPWANGRQSWTNTSKLPLRDEAGEIMGTFAIRRDITQELEMQQALEKAKSNLIDASRSAGMAEVATGVLHNVGNVLTSLNVSAAVIATSLQQSKATGHGRAPGAILVGRSAACRAMRRLSPRPAARPRPRRARPRPARTGTPSRCRRRRGSTPARH